MANNILNNIKSKFILQQISGKIKYNKFLKIIKYNKILQKRFDLGIEDYKNYYEQIEIEIFPKTVIKNKRTKINFINIKRGYKCYYHLYLNNTKNQIRRTYITKKDEIEKIKIVIDNDIKSFENLFHNCGIIEKVNFIKFKRNDITDMSYMFSGCISLKEINFFEFITDNVINMNYMFDRCYSLFFKIYKSF